MWGINVGYCLRAWARDREDGWKLIGYSIVLVMWIALAVYQTRKPGHPQERDAGNVTMRSGQASGAGDVRGYLQSRNATPSPIYPRKD